MANEHALSRRAALGALAGGLLLGAGTPTFASDVIVSQIRVDTRQPSKNLRAISGLVAKELALQLGPRYQPKAKNGVAVHINLSGIDLPTRDDRGSSDGFRSFPSDLLEGRIEVSQGKTVVRSFPLLVTRPAMLFGPPALDLVPDPDRLPRLAQSYAYWLAPKI